MGVVGASVVVAAPAQAAGPSNCELGFFCNYRDINYGTQMTSFQFYIPYYDSYGMHDNISGVWNQGRTSNARIYKDARYGGSSYLIPRGNGDGNMHDAIGTVSVSGWADSIDSAQFI
ncbi:peptidase inhibitor family I36 protein [Leifsonia aquatica]|uniref:peptidase inhibitor family I36 protein n=1 Tax=Leifsonia aquatica TaxID=144185 RepID=UPI0038009D16